MPGQLMPSGKMFNDMMVAADCFRDVFFNTKKKVGLIGTWMWLNAGQSWKNKKKQGNWQVLQNT